MINTACNAEGYSPGLSVELRVADRRVDVAFELPSGQTLGLVGPNGAGKTTTLSALAGWLVPDTGAAQLGSTVLFDCPQPDQPPTTWLPAAQRGIGYVAQEPRLFPHLSARDNIMYGMPRGSIHGRKARRDAAERWLERVGLPGYGSRKPHQLSGGQAQRVAIARVLASGPRLVLLDEPLAALDRSAAPAIRELLAGVLQHHTVIVVSHQSADIDALADTIHHVQTSS